MHILKDMFCLPTGTNVINQDLCVVVNITQSMDVSLIGGYRMKLVCAVFTNIETDPANVAIRWSGMGLKSMWVHQSSVSHQADKYQRQLSFRPWLDIHAGQYTCHVMMKDSQCTVEKTITVGSMYVFISVVIVFGQCKVLCSMVRGQIKGCHQCYKSVVNQFTNNCNMAKYLLLATQSGHYLI